MTYNLNFHRKRKHYQQNHSLEQIWLFKRKFCYLGDLPYPCVYLIWDLSMVFKKRTPGHPSYQTVKSILSSQVILVPGYRNCASWFSWDYLDFFFNLVVWGAIVHTLFQAECWDGVWRLGICGRHPAPPPDGASGQRISILLSFSFYVNLFVLMFNRTDSTWRVSLIKRTTHKASATSPVPSLSQGRLRLVLLDWVSTGQGVWRPWEPQTRHTLLRGFSSPSAPEAAPRPAETRCLVGPKLAPQLLLTRRGPWPGAKETLPNSAMEEAGHDTETALNYPACLALGGGWRRYWHQGAELGRLCDWGRVLVG